jgi:hypothetical protein
MFGHEIDEHCDPFGALKTRLQDQRMGPISASDTGLFILWGNQPAVVFRRTEEGRETGIRIKPWPTQLIYRAIATNQRGCLAVADERVTLNG